jgi:hypothetical protein
MGRAPQRPWLRIYTDLRCIFVSAFPACLSLCFPFHVIGIRASYHTDMAKDSKTTQGGIIASTSQGGCSSCDLINAY